MGKIQYSPWGPDFPDGRAFFHEDVGYGVVELVSGQRFHGQRIGVATVRFTDLQNQPVIAPLGEEKLLSESDFVSDAFAVALVDRAFDSIGLDKPSSN